MFETPIKKALFFLLFPLFFYLIDYLNYSRAGKIALIGFLSIGLIYSLKQSFPNNKFLRFFTPFFILILLLNMSFHGALRDIFGVEQDDIMVIQSIFSTDIQESREFFLQYQTYILKHTLIFISMYILYFFIVNKKGLDLDKLYLKKSLIIFTLLFVIAHLNPSMRRSNPFVYFPYYYNKWQKSIQESEKLFNELNKNIKASKLNTMHYVKKEQKNTLVWVIGESDTRYNWSLYGYERDTNPKLSTFKNELLIFKNIKSSAPITIPAFERMLTPATLKEPELWKKTPDIISMAKQAGYKVYWISNHTTDNYGEMKLFSSRANTTILTNKGSARSEGSFDESLFEPYKQALTDENEKKLIIVHMLGSHPAYNFRYPKTYDKFSGFDDSVMQYLKANGRDEWALIFRNQYDNSVLYSDFVRYELLKILKNSKDAKYSSWVYHPDHGEDVCHNDNFSGHNYKANEQWEVPFIFWSPNVTNMDKNITTKAYQLDMMEHTILGLLGIDGEYYEEKSDLFR